MVSDRRLLGLLGLMLVLVVLVSGCANSRTDKEKPKSLNDVNLKTVVINVKGIT